LNRITHELKPGRRLQRLLQGLLWRLSLIRWRRRSVRLGLKRQALLVRQGLFVMLQGLLVKPGLLGRQERLLQRLLWRLWLIRWRRLVRLGLGRQGRIVVLIMLVR
jgi:hypothetical protein